MSKILPVIGGGLISLEIRSWWAAAETIAGIAENCPDLLNLRLKISDADTDAVKIVVLEFKRGLKKLAKLRLDDTIVELGTDRRDILIGSDDCKGVVNYRRPAYACKYIFKNYIIPLKYL